MPRDDGNQTYNIVALTITFNNLASNLKRRFGTSPSSIDQKD